MSIILQVESYNATVSEDILNRWGDTVRVWSEPASVLDGAKVVDILNQPLEVMVVGEQKDVYGSLTQRAKIRYGNNLEGWVIYSALEIP